ncbi:TetR/AcrR family transcriptional regulator [Pseudomonas rubra]|uniref:TetR/AcrR family transcriptional regulator n=1 Tax=Pseudomonas rubra TaxID=2942627 RepID=A0ABT5P1Z7_9PSED|nr:TetR/AcrR family transcriptional regulator [Pseudomonas rubra]MDD1012300.1 TetR/AcrR family transcriptional regulator [Pseudomonas rubra]MDD1037353.1 TetR/AcrR family transcriptional regulator [Pseudomonas rubra]MDD1153070.1 TetR/AcrR family transcriptional regulator [Pseudomonas rubra]
MSTSEKIAESALQLFYRQGYHGTGVEQLSQEAGVTKKTLYRHFPSKELLIEAALQRRDVDFMTRLQSALAAAPAKARPLAYIDFIEAWARSEGFHGCAFINASAEYAGPGEPPHELAKQHKHKVMVALEQACIDAGCKPQAAQQLFLLGEGLIVASQVSGPQAPLFEAARSMVVALA